MMPIPARTSSATQNTNRIARYYLVREIGRGSFGAVYLARDPIVDRNVAIKTCHVRGNSAEDKDAIQQFINEARATGRLCHPNIVTIFDAGDDGGAAFIAMEYLQGTLLRKLLESGHAFSAKEIAAICGKLADALAHAHKNGVIHRDINPSNIFVLDENQPKIFDFGIARAPNRIQLEENDNKPYTLFNNNLIGTPNYMSPEQATGRQVDHLTDIYSLGAVMYEMLANRRPFQSDSTETLLESIAYKAPPAPHELNKAAPLALSQIAMKAMSKRPEKRYQSGQEMAHDIHLYLTRDGHARNKAPLAASQEKAPSAPPPRLRAPIVLAGLLALAVAVIAYFRFL